eukprot:TRINITY_DN65560_c0_g1_i1.p1 TRINITY_DN65560_c0_g1~~TRINITY_DN65560_c0_g1_i1.p1  ORF type:complete len:463 (+),score=53.23 TRINITY_DN65560_c0_g1_i1:86-1390(+)
MAEKGAARHCAAVVVGGGVAGLSAARALGQIGVRALVLERGNPDRLDRGLGIWDAAQDCLGLIGAGDQLQQAAHFCPPAAYRSLTGKWLSNASAACARRPPRRYEHAEGRWHVRADAEAEEVGRVATLRETELISLLSDGLDIAYQEAVSIDVGDADRAATVRLSGGTELHADLVVVADGARSALRPHIFPGVVHRPLPYVHFSGFATLGEGIEQEEPYESIGRGPGLALPSRFAVIPLRGNDVFWFASMYRPPGPADGLLGRPMATQFAQWHFPIPQIVAEALASPENTLEEAPVVLSARLPARSKGRAVLIGDAAHPMPANLAQGASIAIEDAVALAAALRSAVPGSEGETLQGADIMAALASYSANGTRRRRIAACRMVTYFTQLLTDYPEWSYLMRFVPGPINSRVFDRFLHLSLTGTPIGRDYAAPASL